MDGEIGLLGLNKHGERRRQVQTHCNLLYVCGTDSMLGICASSSQLKHSPCVSNRVVIVNMHSAVCRTPDKPEPARPGGVIVFAKPDSVGYQ
jgi:hypothetical protein